ncbi:hypothetical protein NDU88_007582 [Pleurodeles waltl]|uniref:Uncharacterized protein n=1 Tax=Pleurodeles waltl TaxID=8319 RepID=A0AAV7QMA8_PLEWA|nr:hypothetical protein NDU88_007582 [Pleurodeles waltl]
MEEATGGSHISMEQFAPFEDRRREMPRRLVVPMGDEECGLRGAERDHPPRSRRSVPLAGQRGKEDREENDIGDDRKGRGRERNRGGDRRIPYQHGAVRSLRGQEEGDTQKAGSPNRERGVRTQGSGTRPPATLQEERGTGRCVAISRTGLGRSGGEERPICKKYTGRWRARNNTNKSTKGGGRRERKAGLKGKEVIMTAAKERKKDSKQER